MAEQIVSTATALARGISQAAIDQEESQQSVEDILNCIKDDLRQIVRTPLGQRLIKNVGMLATKVRTWEDFLGMIKELFQLAKDTVLNWLSSQPAQVVMAVFLVLVAGLIVYINLAPESVVAVWVNSLIHDLGVVFANIFHRLKDFTLAVAEFFRRSDVELTVNLLPPFNLEVRVPLAILPTATNMAVSN